MVGDLGLNDVRSLGVARADLRADSGGVTRRPLRDRKNSARRKPERAKLLLKVAHREHSAVETGAPPGEPAQPRDVR